MEATIYNILNDMSESLSISQMKKLQEVLICRLESEQSFEVPPKVNRMYVETPDEIMVQEYTENPLIDIRTYKEKVIDYVRENGDIKREDLIEKPPFDGYDILSLFGQNITFITNLVDTIHNRIMAA